jgi:cation transport regulator ChaB
MVNTGSLVGALWSFFLVQALFSWIPDLAHSQTPDLNHDRPGQSQFHCAHRVALDAVRKLTQP